jgi:plastocyanin
VRSVVLCLIVLAGTAEAGTVRGKVELVEKKSRPSDLSEAVVYVDGIKLKPKPMRATVTMRGKTFSPHLVAVSVGSTVDFPNQDAIFHNVFSLSGENRFDLDLYKRPKSGQWTFQAPGIARVYCNIHPQMSAIVVVRDNPYFVQPKSDGSFVIEDVPTGRHTIKAWHERAPTEPAIEVTVPPAGEVAARLVLDATAYKRLLHKKKDGKDYGTDEKY